jgi:hypothetical protein
MRSACAILYCYPWPVRIYVVFLHYLINGIIFAEEVLDIKFVLFFSTTIIWNISYSKKNLARYCHKYVYVWLPWLRFFNFFFSCKVNARVKTRKDGARLALFLFLCCSMYFLCCSIYCLFCDVLCIVCVYMCTEQLPPGGYPIAVKYIISYESTTTFLGLAMCTVCWVLFYSRICLSDSIKTSSSLQKS